MSGVFFNSTFYDRRALGEGIFLCMAFFSTFSSKVAEDRSG